MDETPNGRASRTHFAADRYPLQGLTGKIIASAFAVFRARGYGFFESVYRRSLVVELRHIGVPVAEEVSYEIFHRDVSVGLYRADVVVDSKVIVETKTGPVLDPTGLIQVQNYLYAAKLTLGLVIHFGPRGATVKRVIASNAQPARRV